MTRRVYDPECGWVDEDGDFAAGFTTALLIIIAFGAVVLLAWNVLLVLGWAVS